MLLNGMKYRVWCMYYQFDLIYLNYSNGGPLLVTITNASMPIGWC